MNSEKVKEIKDSIERTMNHARKNGDYFVRCIGVDTLNRYLTLIKELESENERLILQYERVKADSEMNCLELKDRIAELEKE